MLNLLFVAMVAEFPDIIGGDDVNVVRCDIPRMLSTKIHLLPTYIILALGNHW